MSNNNPQNRPTDNQNTTNTAGKNDQFTARHGEDRKDPQGQGQSKPGMGQCGSSGQSQPQRKGDGCDQDAMNKQRTGPGSAGDNDQSDRAREDGTNPKSGSAPERKGENRSDSADKSGSGEVNTKSQSTGENARSSGKN